jgi:thiol-disulfide isomerase/thioredoxin
MRYYFYLFIALQTLLIGWTNTVYSQEIPVINFSQLEKKINAASDTCILINFMASWCLPCVAELDAFVKLEQQLKNEKFKIFFISLDIKSSTAQLLKVKKEKGIQNNLLILEEPDANKWINKVDSNWSGAIPATWFIERQNHRAHLLEQTFTFDSLLALYNQYKP